MPFINSNEEQIAYMKRILLMALIAFYTGICSMAQLRTVENRPYTDLRPFHFGVLIGTHAQDMEFQNTGITQYIDANGIEQPSHVTVVGTRHLTFYNLLEKDGAGNAIVQHQEMKTAYISSAMDLIFAAERFNNHRPYVMAGINPMMNLNSSKSDYIKLKKSEIFLELGVGCDFYMPFFKLRPELKFMYGLTDSFDKKHPEHIKNKNELPYALAAKGAHSKIIALTFYFE